MEVQIKGEAAQQAPQTPRRGLGENLFNLVFGLAGVALLAAVGYFFAVQFGWYQPKALAPQPTATSAPAATTAPVATRAPAQAQQQTAPTVAPAIHAAPPAPAPAAPAVVVDDAPAELEGAGTSFTRGTICFDGWYFVDGIRSNTPCRGSGGD
jgi:hypothetical protein